ncbi:exonuclease domain-containing protein [Desulfatiferula olefinivorans]
MKRFLFYDLETTGLNKSFDQILQFAAIETDEQLRETNRYAIRVKLRPDVIPSPYAAVTHRMSMADYQDGLDELEAVRHIHALVNTPGTISLGYNTLGFDDEFLRFSFYRNLLSPYTHQYANQCGRMDLLPMAVLYYLYSPGILTWPEAEGKPSLKLELLSRENRLAEGPAHDAMVDVEATLALARRFFSVRDMWDYVTGYFNKALDQERIRKLPVAFDSGSCNHFTGIMTGSGFGPDQLYQAPVLYLGDSDAYKNQSLWLKLDDPALRDACVGKNYDAVRVMRKRMGEPHIILPPLERFRRRLTDQRQHQAMDNLAWLKNESEHFQALVAFFRDFRYPLVEQVDVDGALYLSGFLSRDEQKLCSLFHRHLATDGVGFLSRFDEGPLRTQAMRILFRNLPEAMLAPLANEYAAYMDRVNPATEGGAMVDYRNDKRLTPRAAITQIRTLRAEGHIDDQQRRILDDLEAYLMCTFNLNVDGQTP